MSKPIYVLTTVAVVAVIVSIAWAVSQSPTVTAPDTNEATTITEIFKQGLRTNQADNPNLPDADMFGAALVSIALERFGNNPDAAPQMFAAFEQHVTGKTPREQYSLWDVFLENLEGALLKCRDADHLKANWGIRQRAIEKQTAALKVWADEAGEKLIDGKLADIVTKFEAGVAEEKKRDSNGSPVQPIPDETATKGNDKVWKNGKYQELLDAVLPIVTLPESPAVILWASHHKEENSDASFFERLNETVQEARRLQRIRYSLWAVQILSSDSDITRISHIDTGFLESSASALYSIRESELITQRPDERSENVRKILLWKKVPLSAF